jgi:xylan 1,4-beta-xylosidase
MNDRVCRAIAKVRKQIQSSPMPGLPLFWTEWNVPGMNEVRDTPFVGPALANTVRECDGLVDMMSFWTFSDVFEEGGPISKPFIGEFGLRAKGGINKPSYYDFALLHRLGDLRLANPANDAIVTGRPDGTLVLAIWNLVDPDKQGATKRIHLVFRGEADNSTAMISRVDREHSNVLLPYKAMGAPADPTEEQVKKLNLATALPPPEQVKLVGDSLDLDLPANALVLIEIGKARAN